jgi:hypothetical protein
MNEPNEFQGIAWGTIYNDFCKLYTDVVIFKENAEYKTKDVERRNEIKKLGSARIESILYYFFDNKFYGVEIITRGTHNSQLLLNHLASVHGDDFEYETTDLGYVYHRWNGITVNIETRYSKKGDMMLTYFYKPIVREVKKHEEEYLKKTEHQRQNEIENKIKRQQLKLPNAEK